MRFSVFEKNLKKVKDYLQNGQYKKAMDFIGELEKKNYSEIEKDILKLRKSQALFRYGHYNLAFELNKDVLPKFLANDLPKYYLEALAQKAIMLIEKSKTDEALEVLKQKESILDSLPTEKLEEIYEARCSLLLYEGVAYFHKHESKRALNFAKESLEIAEYYDNKLGIGIIYIFIADCIGRLGQVEKAVEYREEALRLFTELENPYWIAYVQHYFGRYYASLGDYDLAIEYYLKIMPFVDKTENAYQKIVTLLYLAETYRQNLDQEIAYDYYLQAYQLLENTERLDLKYMILKNLAWMTVNKGEIEKADEYFEEVKPIIQQLNDPKYDLTIRTFEIWKLRRRFFETKSSLILEEVENKLRELINDETINYRRKIGLKMDLCKILLDVYLNTGNNEVIDEIESLTSELLESSSKYDSEIYRISILTYRLLALWIQAKIIGDDKKIDEVRLLLSKTEEYAGVKGNKLLLKSIKQAQEYYSSLMEELDTFVKSFATTK